MPTEAPALSPTAGTDPSGTNTPGPQTATPEPQTLLLPVRGMSCAACQSHVEHALRGAPGVLDATVNLMTHSARVIYVPAATSPAALVSVVEESGYESSLPGAAAASDQTSDTEAAQLASLKAERRLRLHAALTIAGGVLAMLLSMPLIGSGSMSGGSMAAHPTGVHPWTMRLLPWLYAVPATALRIALFLMALLAMVWTGAPIYARAARAFRHRTTNMNTLVALGTGAAFLYSAAATFAPGLFLRHGLQPDVYFDSVLFILGFLVLGNWLDARAKRRTLASVRAFTLLQPSTAHILRNGVELELPVESVLPDDTVVVRPGERFPVDGIVQHGASTVDESLITGESTPVLKSEGASVIGGSLNYDGSLEYRATSVGADSTLSQMLRLMEHAQSSKAPMQQLADRASRIFVPAVLVLAAVTFAAWISLDGGVSRALFVAVAVLVIACPCAMGLAVPAALTVAIGRAAELGILFKGGEAVERIAAVDTIVFDKTGTLTEGQPRVTGISAQDPDRILRLAASLEQRSEHPLARAVLKAAEDRHLALLPVANFTVFPGSGLAGIVGGMLSGEEGARPLLVGNARLLVEHGVSLPAHVSEEPGVTLLHIAENKHYLGAIACRDTLRAGAGAAIPELQRLGLNIAMLTGDSPAAAAHVAQQTGISEVHAGLLPDQKLERIRSLQQAGARVLMVGDGINDAAALAQADAGVAIGTGTDLAREAGDAILLRGDPATLVAALRLARATRRVMRQNLGWAIGYNLVGIPIAAGLLFPVFGILLSPAVASAAMALSSVSVLANSLRLRRFASASIRTLPVN